MSLAKAIAGASVLTLALLWGFLFYYLFAIYEKEVRAIQRENVGLVQLLEQNINRVFDVSDISLRFLKKEYEADAHVDNAIRDFIGRTQGEQRIRQVGIADEAGNILISSRADTTSVAGKNYFQVQREAQAGLLYIDGPQEIAGQPVLHLSRRLEKPDGSFGGIVFLAVSPQELLDFHRSVHLRPSQFFFLANAEGETLVRRVGEKGQHEVEDLAREVLRLADSGQFPAQRAQDLIVQDHFISYYWMDGYPLLVVAGIDRVEALSWYHREIYMSAGSVMVATVLILLVTSGLLWFLRRFELLNKQYEAVVNQSLEGIVLFDKETRRVIEVNPSYLELTGFTATEAADFSLSDVLDWETFGEEGMAALLQRGKLKSRIQRLKTKSGQGCEVERTAVVIHHNMRQALLFNFRDLTRQKRLEHAIYQDVALAGKIQQALMPGNLHKKQMDIEVIYSPVSGVSGDFLNYRWDRSRKVVSGYLCDVTGHGVATALQTAAARVVLDEMLKAELTYGAVEIINARIRQYLNEGSFIAMLLFEIDLMKSSLKVAACGINAIPMYSARCQGVLEIDGGYIGLLERPDVDIVTMPVGAGDKIYFATDGLLDLLSEDLPVQEFAASVAKLRQLSQSPERFDDCSALCIQIKEEDGYPIMFTVNWANLAATRSDLEQLLERRWPETHVELLVVLNEAINNALKAGGEARVKLAVYGCQLIMRVKDGGEGFDGNGRLRHYAHHPLEASLDDSGRGIFIMTEYCDRIYYNRSGNEVMLIKTVGPSVQYGSSKKNYMM